jgi:hypothetical protein
LGHGACQPPVALISMLESEFFQVTRKKAYNGIHHGTSCKFHKRCGEKENASSFKLLKILLLIQLQAPDNVLKLRSEAQSKVFSNGIILPSQVKSGFIALSYSKALSCPNNITDFIFYNMVLYGIFTATNI